MLTHETCLPVVLSVLEEVGVLVDPLDGRVNRTGQAPVLDVFGIVVCHRILAGRIELEVVGVLEEVDLAVATPHERGVQVERDSGKPVGNRFRISGLNR